MKVVKSKTVGLIAMVAMAAGACTGEYERKIEELHGKAMQDSLNTMQREQALADSFQLVWTQAMQDIQRDVNNILRDEGILVEDQEGFSESAIPAKEQIQNRVADLGEVIRHNKHKIDQLVTQLEKSDYKNKQLERTLASTKTQLEEHEQTIEDLMIALEDERLQYAYVDQGLRRMIAQNDSMGQRIEKLDAEVHTGYYAMGSFKDLKEQGVLAKEGGVLAVGAAKVLDDDFSSVPFEKVDIRKSTQIPVHASKAELITKHPTDSYTFTYEGDEVAYLAINDPQEFWKASKYMVLQTR